SNTVYATYSTFGGQHVWRSLDGGVNWTALNGAGTTALPDLPVNGLAIDPNNPMHLYAATDFGLFASRDGGATWTTVEAGFGQTVVESLTMHTINNVTSLYAFTGGRGAWRITLGNNNCAYALSVARLNVPATGGNVTVRVTAPAACGWQAAANPSAENLATVVSGTSGAGNGTVTLNVKPNLTSRLRRATVAIAGRSVSLEQAGALDTTPPTIRLTSPATSEFTTNQPILNVSGTTSDDLAVTEVAWMNERGINNFFSETRATGTLTWTAENLLLQEGINRFIFTARDGAGNSSSTMLTVRYFGNLSLFIVAGGEQEIRENVPPRATSLSGATNLLVDETGNLFYTDHSNDLIRKIDARTGLVTTVAGSRNGNSGVGEGDGGPATQASLVLPYGIALDRTGNLYLADFGHNRVRKVDATGIITNFAGTGCVFRCGSGGDGGPATQAAINRPYALLLDEAGNLLITEANRVRRVDIATGLITTIAGGAEGGPANGDGGPATQATLNNPTALAFDRAGNLFISESGASRIRKVDKATGIITTFAGNGLQEFPGIPPDGKPANQTALTPLSIAFDPAGNLFVATGNATVRRIDAATNLVTTVAGGGTGAPFDGTPALTAAIQPYGLAFDTSGQLLMGGPNVIHRLAPLRLADTTPPVLTVTAPATTPRINATAPFISLAGKVTDNRGVAYVSWRNERAFSGIASQFPAGATDWQIGTVPLAVGLNNVFLTAWDNEGNSTTLKLEVTFTPARVARTNVGQSFANRPEGDLGDGGAAFRATLNNPQALALDAQENLFIADTGHQRIRKVTRAGVISTVAGNGERGFSGDGAPATQAALNDPSGVAIDAAGNLFIADTGNHCIRKVAPDGTITTVAGNGLAGLSGDGGPGRSATLNSPTGLALDGSGNLFIADTGNHRIRKLTAVGMISTVAGSLAGFAGDGGPATTARLAFPNGLTFDASGNLLIADTSNNRIRKVTPAGVISTLPLTSADFPLAFPVAVAVDASGALYLANRNASQVLRAGSDNTLTLYLGGSGGFSGSEYSVFNALYTTTTPTGLAIARNGEVFVADGSGHRVLTISAYQAVFSTHAASYAGMQLASDTIVAAFGTQLSTVTQAARSVPLPTELSGTRVAIRDRAGNERNAPLFFVSPTQINYLLPAGLVEGIAEVAITNSRGEISNGFVEITPVAPGLFAANANGQGVAAGLLLRVKADGTQVYEPLANFDATRNAFVARALEFGPANEQLF
ncbi:MAG: hypothetical protein HOP19_14455, partial [Acidobacteria bacterium]|nr:hypothetical protein [Acidobacteriota bacterium]